MRRAPSLRLRRDERKELEDLAANPRISPRISRRAQVVLQASQGARNDVIARRIGTSPGTVARWRRRFIAHGVPGITREAPRPGRPPVIPPSKVVAVLRRTMDRSPPHGGRWTARALAAETGLSRSTIQRIWKARGIDPRRQADRPGAPRATAFFERVTDMVGLFLDPPERAIAFSTDEGTQSPRLLAADRRLLDELRQRNRDAEFQAFLQAIDRETPSPLDIHLLVDSRFGTSSPEIEHWLIRHPRLHLHYVSPDARGSSAIDRLFAELSKKRVHREASAPVWQLHRAIRAHFRMAIESAKPFVWTATGRDIRGRFGRPVIPRETNGTRTGTSSK
ncbi:MAG TPA: helix-turn-helix domain-containing protein [Thermoplasmata archaeon]|nr:helix-turn-helix domain-containing protein [Thermoplasmata archaeon]